METTNHTLPFIFKKNGCVILGCDLHSRHFAFRGRAGEPPRRFAPAGSPLPRTPAGVFVPSVQINRVPKSTITFNTAKKIRTKQFALSGSSVICLFVYLSIYLLLFLWNADCKLVEFIKFFFFRIKVNPAVRYHC